MRGARWIPELSSELILHFPESSKPDPIVPKALIEEVGERVGCKGQVVVELNDVEAEAAIRRLVAKGVEAIVSRFLWAFGYRDKKEQGGSPSRVQPMLPKLFPDSTGQSQRR